MRQLCLLLFIFCSKISAQTEVKGFVIPVERQQTFKANIILLDENNEIETFGFSDKTGSFSVFTDKLGTFKLQIKAFNFNSKEIDVKITSQNQIINLGTIEIDKLKETEIKEVVITRANPIRIQKDTVEFKVQNFSTGAELNVEELLKKLPGITVESDGKIKFGNKEVERVMVENDDLFERGYQTLTQNMPTKPLDKVQVLRKYSRNKLLKGIENSESVAINLTLKEDAKSKWFGNTLLASTSYKENMHQAKLNLMNFSKRKKIYTLLNYNNLGLDEMKGVDYLINPSSDKDVENVGSNLRTLSIINLHSKNAQFEDKRTNFNNDKLASLNYIFNFPKDWKLKFVTVFNQTENRNFINSYTKFNYSNVNFTNIESKTWKQSRQNIVGKFELLKEYKNASLMFYNKLPQLNEDNNNNFIFNGKTNLQNGENKLFANENRLVFTQKIDSSRACVAVAKYLQQNRSYFFTDENEVFQFITENPNAQKIEQSINSKMQFGGVKFSYLKSWSEDRTFELQMGDEFRKDFLHSDIALYNSAGQNITFDNSGFINNNDFLQNNLFSQIKYINKRNKWNYGFTVLNQFISSESNFENKNGFYISPSFSLGYQNKKTGNFNLSAARKFSSTGITDVFTNYIYQGNRNFKQNNIGIQQLPEYNISFSYNLGDVLSEYLQLNVFYFKNEEFISNNMIVNPNYTFNQSILVKNNTNLSANMELRKYLKFLKSRFSFLNSFFQSNYQNSVNSGELIKTQFSNFKTGFEMKSGWTKKINYEAGYEWVFNNINSEINQRKYTDEKGFVNLYYSFNPLFRFESYFEFFKYGNTSQKILQFLDFKVNYQLKDYKMNLFLMGNNLLNSNEIQRFSIINISESLYTQKLLPRHLVFGINKNF